jgi:cobaltochelatase CobS
MNKAVSAAVPSGAADPLLTARPDTTVSARDFGIESDMQVPAFSTRTEYVPTLDTSYRFDPDTTLAILAPSALPLAM